MSSLLQQALAGLLLAGQAPLCGHDEPLPAAAHLHRCLQLHQLLKLLPQTVPMSAHTPHTCILTHRAFRVRDNLKRISFFFNFVLMRSPPPWRLLFVFFTKKAGDVLFYLLFFSSRLRLHNLNQFKVAMQTSRRRQAVLLSSASFIFAATLVQCQNVAECAHSTCVHVCNRSLFVYLFIWQNKTLFILVVGGLIRGIYCNMHQVIHDSHSSVADLSPSVTNVHQPRFWFSF